MSGSTTPPREKPNPALLSELIARIKDSGSATVVSQPRNEEWPQMIARTTVPGRIFEVTEKIYWEFLEVLPPRWMGCGFAFAEGGDDIRFYWKVAEQHYYRQLTTQETDEFYRLIGSHRYL